MNIQQHIKVLGKKDHVLVKLRVGYFRGRKTSDLLAQEAAKKHAAKLERIAVRLQLLAPEDTQKLRNVAKAASRIVRNETLPYDGTWRLTTTKAYTSINKRVGALKRDMEEIVNEMANRFGRIVEQAKRDLPGLVSDSDFPHDADDFRSRFSFTFAINKVSSASDIEFDLPEAELNELREQIKNEERTRFFESYKWLADWATETLKPLLAHEITPHAAKQIKKVADFIDQNTVGDASVTNKLRAIATSKQTDKKETKAAVDSVLDELANFGK